MYDRGQGYCSTRSRYSVAIVHVSGMRPRSNRAGLCKFPSAVITPLAPVSLKHRSMSSIDIMFPFAKMGTATFSLQVNQFKVTNNKYISWWWKIGNGLSCIIIRYRVRRLNEKLWSRHTHTLTQWTVIRSLKAELFSLWETTSVNMWQYV